MINLEETAKKMFIEYANRKLGHDLDWAYLSKERQLVWLQEVHFMYISCIKNIQKEIKPHIQPSGVASYERGFVAGQNHEQQQITSLLELIGTDLNKQLNIFSIEDSND